MQGSVTGRLLSYSPKTKKTHVLAGDLFYANGVVVAHDQSFLLVVETMSVTIHKYWLKGPKVREHVSKHAEHQALIITHCMQRQRHLCFGFEGSEVGSCFLHRLTSCITLYWGPKSV